MQSLRGKTGTLLRIAARWSAAGVGMVAGWLGVGLLGPLVAADSEPGGRFVFDWLRGMAAVAVGGLVFVRVMRGGTQETGSGYPWIGLAVFVTLCWFPIALDRASHRAEYLRTVLRWPAGMWAGVWVLMQLAVASRRSSAKWKTRASEVVLLVAAPALPVAALEAYYRWTLPTNAAGADDLCTITWLKLYDPNLSDPRGYFQFRDAPEPGAKRTGERRVLFLGDSITYGWGVDREEDLMSRVCERRLRRQTGAEVVTGNIAYFNRDTRQQRQMLREYGFVWRPDVVVLVHDLGDITGETGPVPSPKLRPPGKLTTWLTRRSFLANRLYWTHVFRTGLNEDHRDWLVEQYDAADVWSRHREVLSGLFADCRARNVRVLLVLSPFLSSVQQYPPGLRAVHKKLVDFGREEGVAVLDGLDLFAGTRAVKWMVNRADRHPNEAAHRRYGESIAEAVVPLLEAGAARRDGPGD